MQVAHHAADHGHLLRVLLAKDHPVGAHSREQLGHHGRHASKMVRPDCTFQHLGRAADLHGHGEAVRIDLINGRRPHQIRTGRCGQFEVTVLISRVRRKVLGGAELGWIDEQRHHHGVACVVPNPHERQVALVKRTHRGHQSDVTALSPQCCDGSAQVRNRAYHCGSRGLWRGVR